MIGSFCDLVGSVGLSSIMLISSSGSIRSKWIGGLLLVDSHSSNSFGIWYKDDRLPDKSAARH
jgi:hypothetical protein